MADSDSTYLRRFMASLWHKHAVLWPAPYAHLAKRKAQSAKYEAKSEAQGVASVGTAEVVFNTGRGRSPSLVCDILYAPRHFVVRPSTT